MHRLLSTAVICLAVSTTAHAAVIPINVNPLIGSAAVTTPGRQIVNSGLEAFVAFNPALDVFLIDTEVFDVTTPLSFANGLTTSLPASGAEVIVVQNGPPLGAGGAADAIAAQLTSGGPGFFVYFNSGLDVPRLVYSTNLDDANADLAILARLTNLAGNRDALPLFTASNFDGPAPAVPEPSLLVLAGMAVCGLACRRRGRTR